MVLRADMRFGFGFQNRVGNEVVGVFLGPFALYFWPNNGPRLKVLFVITRNYAGAIFLVGSYMRSCSVWQSAVSRAWTGRV